ncbi:flagellar hook protein FlgE [Rhodoferax sp.]|uniref:flagellar hook protein FlgE n=1 Tax=Rhodoferax sp. TaxID=50421 RepID=UPI0026224ED3|nr:flagellar hook protein FlgE [Rhodoferax sp.]MDD4945049.1 flagellar hook protein FlgE [Rhodoferax sp.]MDD5478613.1 flagellar hook protein FlgE [Rhodoferax sp.]
MSFQTGLAGLNASSRSLDVIGNNIANANTTGMKSSRAEFNDLIASSLGIGGGSGTQGGIGVAVGAIAQQFTQGNITITGNNLDVAINGGGFFQLTQSDGSTAYTRDGSFKLDKDGYIKTNTGAFVMGFDTDLTGKPTSTTATKRQLPTTAPIAASATTLIGAEFNLDARAAVATAGAVRTEGTAITLYDSQGSEVPLSMYFERVATTTTDNWDVYDAPTGGTLIASLSFGADGTLTTPAAPVSFTVTNPHTVAGDITATIDFSKATQYGSSFAVSNLTQNGYAPGELTGLNINESGVITARYSNGQTQYNGQLALADFRNVQGLQPLGGNAWSATFASGNALVGSPGVGRMGAIRSGALEESNVDLTAELVNMMTAQRSYQANAQTIKTQDQIMSTLVNLR